MAANPLDELTMSYEGLVEAGRAAREFVEDYQWREGDLAMQVETLEGNDRPRTSDGKFLAGESALKQYADDIEMNHRTLLDYRNTAKAWPPSRRRDGASWSVHRELAPVSDRFDQIRDDMSLREARELSKELRGLNTNASRVGPGWFELLGEVGDTLIKAGKQLDKFDAAVEDNDYHDDLKAKAGEYAQWADDIAARLRSLA